MRTLTRRDFARSGAAAAMTAWLAPQALAQAAKPADDLWYVNPELRPAARQLQAMTGSMAALGPDSLAASRKGMAGFGGPPLAAPAWEKRAIKGAPGAPDVTIYVINAAPGGARPAILHTHGGGYVLGDAITSVPDLQKTAQALDCVIVTVDYRLAPESDYRASVEDNYAGLRWLHANAAALGVDPKRIAVMGESAGGGHAALLALVARDRGEVPVLFQSLVYPMLDDRTGTTRAVPPHIGTLLWTAAANDFGWRSFLGQPPGTATVPAQAVPARYDSLKGLPPAFIGVGSIDLFVDEDIAYARRLVDAGVETELMVVPGAFHGFDGIAADTSLAKAFTAAKLAALRRAFAQGA